MTENLSTEKTSDRLSSLTEALNSGAMLHANRMLNNLHPSEIADLLESLPLAQRKFIWSMVGEELEGDVLLEMGEEVRNTLISDMDKEELRTIIENLDTDDMADLLLSLPEAVIRETLLSLDKQRLKQVETVLSYPEDTAGGLMDLDIVTIRPNVSLEIVHRYLRMLGELPEHTDRLMVVDRNNTFLGIALLRKIVVNPPETLVADIMEYDEEAIQATLADHEVARLFKDYDLIIAPVVDENNKLVGRITIDDVVDVIVDEAEKSVRNMAGLDEDEDIFSPVIKSTQRRAVWLGINLVTALIASRVIGIFEDTIQHVVALAILMPIVASMGGIAGSQTLTLVIRAQALGLIGLSNARSLLTKELSIGATNGCIWALVVAIIATIWFENGLLGFIIAVAIIINLVAAALSGVAIPLLLRKLNVDPALAGGVILTTVTDVVGFIAFLGTATLLLI